MSETEKLLQVGRLTEEYSRLKGELNHLEEKIKRAQFGAQFFSNNAGNLRADEDSLALVPGTRVTQGNLIDLQGMLSYREALEAFGERKRLQAEVAEVGKRLNSIAPNVTGVMY